MKKRIFQLKTILIILFAISLLPGAISVCLADLDIYGIDIIYGKDHYDGLPLDQSELALPPWEFEIEASGWGITSIDVTLPNGNTIFMTYDPSDDDWGFRDGTLNTRDELLSKYPMGIFAFSFNGGEDSVELSYNEPEPLGFANITYPSNDATNVTYDNPLFTWDSCVGFGQSLEINVEEGNIELFDADGPIDMTQVTVTGLQPGHTYKFGIDLCNEAIVPDQTAQSGDIFRYRSEFSFYNYVNFSTIPEPASSETMLLGLALFIMDEVDSENISPELEGSLLVKIDAASAALYKDNPNAVKVAMNDLKALINQVEAQVDKKITSEAAAEIIQRANDIIAALGG